MSSKISSAPSVARPVPEDMERSRSLDSVMARGHSQDQAVLNDRLPFSFAPRTGILKSNFILALALFFAIDLFARIAFHPDRFNLPEHSQIWWTVNGFKNLDRLPDILIFG